MKAGRGLPGRRISLRIPAKANADSEGNANGIPGRRRTALGALLAVRDVGFVLDLTPKLSLVSKSARACQPGLRAKSRTTPESHPLVSSEVTKPPFVSSGRLSILPSAGFLSLEVPSFFRTSHGRVPLTSKSPQRPSGNVAHGSSRQRHSPLPLSRSRYVYLPGQFKRKDEHRVQAIATSARAEGQSS